MAIQYLTSAFRATPIRCIGMISGAGNTIGGDLDRESGEGDGDQALNRSASQRVTHFRGSLYWWHATRVYKFVPDAVYVTAGTFSGSYTHTEGGAWTSSGGAAGTFIEDYVSGDGFIKLLVTSGTVGSGETITVTVGSHTCVTTAAQTSRGTTNYEGEWGVTHTLSATLEENLGHTGLHVIAKSNVQRLAGFFLSTGGTGTEGIIQVLEFDGTTWSETSSGVSSSTSTTHTAEFGRVTALNDGLICFYSGPSTEANGTYRFVHWVASTGTFNLGYPNLGGQLGAACRTNRNVITCNFVEFKGTVYCYLWSDSGSALLSGLYAQSGTSLTINDGSPGGRTVGTGTTPGLATRASGGSVTEPNERGSTMFVIGDSMYALVPGWNSGSFTSYGNVGWWLLKWHKSGSSIVCDSTHHDETTNELGSIAYLMATHCLPSARAITNATMTANGEQRWRPILDLQTNDPDGQAMVQLLDRAGPGGGTGNIYTFEGVKYDNDGTEYAWNGTTTVTINSGTTGVSVGEYVGMTDDNEQVFYVSAVSAGVSLTIVARNNQTIPSGTETGVNKLQTFTAGSTDTATAAYACAEDVRGGGAYLYAANEYDVAVTAAAAAAGGFKVSFLAYSDNGTDTVKVELFYGDVGETECNAQGTLVGVSGGSATRSGNQMQNVTADGSTTYGIVWDAESDGVTYGESRPVVLKVFS